MCRIHVLTSSNWTDQKIQNFGNHTIETKLIYIYTKSNYIETISLLIMVSKNLNWLVLASYALSATKLNVRSRFQPQILYCQSFIHFWPLEVQKFRAHKIEPLLTRIRFSQSYFNLAKNDFYSWYPHRRDKHSMQKPMEKRKIVVIWKFILHFSIVFSSNSLNDSGT